MGTEKRRKADSVLYRLSDVAPLLHSLITTAAIFACFYFLLKNAFPESNKEIIIYFSGVVTGVWSNQQNFYFGSTAAGKAKDSTIQEIASRPVAAVAPVLPIAPLAPAVPPIIVKNAEHVSAETKEGDITIAQKPNETKEGGSV